MCVKYDEFHFLNIFSLNMRFSLQVLQAAIMISSVVIVAVLGIYNVGGLTEVWDRAVAGNRVFRPEYIAKCYFLFEI